MDFTNISHKGSDQHNQYSYLDSIEAKLKLLKQTPTFTKFITKRQFNQSQSISSPTLKSKRQVDKITQNIMQKQSIIVTEANDKISQIIFNKISQKKPLSFFSDRLQAKEVERVISSKTGSKESILHNYSGKKQKSVQDEKMRKTSLYILGVIRRQNQKQDPQLQKKNKRISLQCEQRKKVEKFLVTKFGSRNFYPSSTFKSLSNSNYSGPIKKKYGHSSPKPIEFPKTKNIQQNSVYANSLKKSLSKVPENVNTGAKIKFPSKIIEQLKHGAVDGNFKIQPWQSQQFIKFNIDY